MANKVFSDYTEAEFLALVRAIFNGAQRSEEEHIDDIQEFDRVAEHPSGRDLIYYPESDGEPTPESVVGEVREWRAQNGLPGFKVS